MTLYAEVLRTQPRQALRYKRLSLPARAKFASGLNLCADRLSDRQPLGRFRVGRFSAAAEQAAAQAAFSAGQLRRAAQWLRWGVQWFRSALPL